MGKRKSKGCSKKSKSKKCREKNSQSNSSQKEEKNSQNAKYEGFYETTSQDNVEEDVNDVHTYSITEETSTEAGSETNSTDTTNTSDINDCCEEIKEKQEALSNKLQKISEALIDITLIRDNINFIKVDTLTELYFTRQVRPLLDALNIISFAVSNMTTAAINMQTNTFGDRKEIRHSLNLSYKMNDEVEDIIDALGRRLKIFVNQIDKSDKNCPPFD